MESMRKEQEEVITYHAASVHMYVYIYIYVCVTGALIELADTVARLYIYTTCIYIYIYICLFVYIHSLCIEIVLPVHVVVVVHHVTFVAIGHGLLEEILPMVIGYVLRTVGSSVASPC